MNVYKGSHSPALRKEAASAALAGPSWMPFPTEGYLFLTAAFLLLAGLLFSRAWAGSTAAGLASSTAVPQATTSADVNYLVSLYGGSHAQDPLVTLEGGVQVKASNYHGVSRGGETYYYDATPHQSFDPLSRGVVGREDIVVVAVVEDPLFPMTIYTIKGGHRRP